jgi:hypothetical protein
MRFLILIAGSPRKFGIFQPTYWKNHRNSGNTNTSSMKIMPLWSTDAIASVIEIID